MGPRSASSSARRWVINGPCSKCGLSFNKLALITSGCGLQLAERVFLGVDQVHEVPEWPAR